MSAGRCDYIENNQTDVSIRIITDHIRSVTFMVSDGILPSNEGRGYVLRRLLRRAARHGRLLGIKGKFLSDLSRTVIETSKDGYPELEEHKDYIFKVITQEEDKFDKTIDQGLSILSEMKAALKASESKILSGEDAFKLYDTYGFPMDLTEEILEDDGIEIDKDGFKAAMDEQREKARAARKTTNYMGADVTVYQSIDPAVTSKFVGYENEVYTSKITVLTTEEDIVPALSDGQDGTIFVEETPFYATSGGQAADAGFIYGNDSVFEVKDVIKLQGGKIGHVGTVIKGVFKNDENVELKIDATKRRAGAKNHSATHLLQKALKEVLGSHAQQAGSNVDENRLRFDFTHFAPMTKEEIDKVEAIVNEKIEENLPVLTKVMPIEEAKKTGAMALFGEKYGDDVRVVSMGDFSKELCGGTHVSNTGKISVFKIVSEAGVAAGVRRIEALTSKGVFEFYNHMEEELNEASKAAKTEPAQLVKRIETLLEEMKALQAENEKLKNKMAKEAMGDVMSQVVEVKGVKLLATKMQGVDMTNLMNLGDQLKTKLGDGVVVLASENDGKVSLLAMATDSAMKAGAHAGNLIKGIAKLVGGGGGGRPNMAQAGGKNPSGIDAALEEAKKVLEGQLG